MSNPCDGVTCPTVFCADGFEPTIAPGACCAQCEPVAPIDASAGPCDQMGFATFLDKQITSLDARSCSVDADCTIMALDTNCQSDCGTILNTKSVMAIYSAARQFASMNCTGCVIAGGGCNATLPRCVNGQCAGILALPP